MKTDHFIIPNSLYIEYQELREGPSPVYIAWKPNTSQSFHDTKSLLKFAQWPKSTPTGQQLRDWLSQFQPKLTPDTTPTIAAQS